MILLFIPLIIYQQTPVDVNFTNSEALATSLRLDKLF